MEQERNRRAPPTFNPEDLIAYMREREDEVNRIRNLPAVPEPEEEELTGTVFEQFTRTNSFVLATNFKRTISKKRTTTKIQWP